MNIAIYTDTLENGHRNRGIGVYTRMLLETVIKNSTKYTYLPFTKKSGIPKNADLVHYPSFDPFFLTLPLVKRKPVVVTIHDLIPLHFQKEFSPGFRGAVKWKIQKLSLITTRRIITDSEASKADINRYTGIRLNRIIVIPLAPSPVFRQETDGKVITAVRQKYLLPDSYVLYVGDVNWNKNVAGLLRAFSIIQCRKNLSLVLVGKVFHNSELAEVKTIRSLINSLKLNDKIIFPGYIPDGDLKCVYTQALCYVQPSHFEGFGLPVLEAMMCGCPVVTTTNGSLAEIAGPAIKAESSFPESIASAVQNAINIDSFSRRKLISDQLLFARRFTWQKTVHETVRVYEKILEK